MKTWFLLSELGVSEFNHCTELTRAVFIFFVSLILSVSLSRPLIYFLKKLQMGQVVDPMVLKRI